MSGTYPELLKKGFEVGEIKPEDKDDIDDDSTQVENKLTTLLDCIEFESSGAPKMLLQKRCTATSFPV